MKAIQTSLRIILATVALGSLGAGLSSCKTTQGFGRDLQHLGAKIEHKAAETGRY
jgi:predicted small secreted protein